MDPKTKIARANLALTYDCNLRCGYCFCGQKRREKMSRCEGEEALKYLINNAADHLHLNFFGGEPLLQEDLVAGLMEMGRKLAAVKGIKIVFQITTNGTIYPAETLKHLKFGDVALLVSSDGIPVAHDRHRKQINGEGSFEQVRQNLEQLLAEGCIVDIRLTITPETVPYFAESVKYFLNKGIRCVYSDIVVEADWNRPLMMALAEQYQQAADFYVDSMRRGDYVGIGFIENLIKHRLSKSAMRQCGAGVNHISIYPGGEVFACYTFAGSWNREKVGLIGNIQTGIFEERRKPYLQYMQDWNPLDECRKCLYLDICFSSCFGNNLRATGNMVRMAASACANERLTANIAFKTADLLLSEYNKTFSDKIAEQLFRPYVCRSVL